MDATRPVVARWYCDVCEGATFASAHEKARHFVSKRHAICLDNWQKAERASAGLAVGGAGGDSDEVARNRKADAERAKAMAVLLKDQREAANALHARLEAQLVRLQLLDEALNTCERLRLQQQRSSSSSTMTSAVQPAQDEVVVVGFEDQDDERGAWSAAKQRVFMQRIYDVVSARGIQPDQVMNVYRWGSRWWGHHSPRSDYDFVVLVRDWNQPSTQNVLEEDDIDLAVYEVNLFQQLINQHVPWVCVFMSYPPEGILMERHKLHWDYRANKFLGGVRKNMFKNYNIAKQYWQYGEIKRSKKRFIYVVKHWALSLQLAKTQTVTDRHVLNDVTQTLMRTHFPNWNEFHKWYRNYGDKAEAAIKEITQAYKQFELDWWATKGSPSGSHLAVVDYIAQYGFGELIKNLDINVELMDPYGTRSQPVGKDVDKMLAASEAAQLVLLSSEKVGSPASSRITFECASALVLARSSDGTGWRPVAQAFPRYRHLYPFHGSDKKRVEEEDVWAIIKAKQVGIEDLSDVNWDSAEAHEAIDGHLGVLFCHSGKWLVHVKTRRATQQADLVSEFWRLYAAQGITDQSLNNLWCYIFQLVSSRYSRDMKYKEDALVLVGVRDFRSPLCPEIDLHRALDGQPAVTFQSCHNKSDDATTTTATHTGWLIPRRFPRLHDQAAMERKVRRQSPLSFKGLVISERAPQPAATAPALSASSCRRVMMSSPAHLWLAKLRALEMWELEGDWDDEEGADGEIDFPMERERCLFELVLLFMQWRSRQQTRTRRGDKGKWKRLRRERRAAADDQTSAVDPQVASTSPDSTDDHEPEHEEEVEMQAEGESDEREPQRDLEEDKFLELHEDYREGYLAVKATFLETCRQIDLCYTQLNHRCPSMKDWARECEKERYKPLLFVLKKRDFPSTRSFYTDYESMHEPRVEKVSYYILDYMHELARQGPRQPTPPPGPTKPLYRWQG